MAPKITAITAQKRHPQRVNIYIDGEFAFGLARVVAAWLQIGQELTPEDIARLREADAQELAYQRVLRYLSYRDRSETEIRRYLQKHNTAPHHIEAVLTRLRELGLVNDAKFATAWVENRNTFRPRGRRALRAELHQKGLPEDAIAQALEDLDEAQLAYQAAKKRLRRYCNLPWPTFRQRLGAYLARRGFPYDVITATLARVWQEIHPDSPSATLPEDIPDNEETPCTD